MHLLTAAVSILAVSFVSAQLNELAKAAGKKYFGTATDTGELSNFPYYSVLTNTSEFGQLTPANGQKWEFVEPEDGVFNYTEGTFVTSVAQKTGQLLRCHNLVWYSQIASYVNADAWDKANLTAMLKEHVYREASHWAGQCYAWDVVNEALNDNGTYRSDVFYDLLGTDYFLIAFEQAALADPSAKLYYNDYNIEYPGPKTDATKGIIKLVKDAGLRIDGIGLQSHFVAGGTPSIDDQISAMQGYVDMGVEVAQTELDVRIELPVNASNLEQQKQDYKTSVGACMQVEKCVGTTVWDFYDPFSWVPGVFTGNGAADLWFDNFTKHPAYEGVVEALTNDTKTNGTKSCTPRPDGARMSKRLY